MCMWEDVKSQRKCALEWGETGFLGKWCWKTKLAPYVTAYVKLSSQMCKISPKT